MKNKIKNKILLLQQRESCWISSAAAAELNARANARHLASMDDDGCRLNVGEMGVTSSHCYQLLSFFFFIKSKKGNAAVDGKVVIIIRPVGLRQSVSFSVTQWRTKEDSPEFCFVNRSRVAASSSVCELRNERQDGGHCEWLRQVKVSNGHHFHMARIFYSLGFCFGAAAADYK